MSSKRLLGLGGFVLSACAHAPPAVIPPQVATSSPIVTPSPSAVPVPAPTPPVANLVDLEVSANRSWFAALNEHDTKALVSLYAPDATVFVGLGLSESHGADAAGKMAEVLWGAFPDSKAQWSRLLSSGKAVAVEFAWTGTSTGPIRDHLPTRKTGGVHALLVEKFDTKGLILEQHIYFDADALATSLSFHPGRAHAFDGLPTSQETILDRAVETADDDSAMRKIAADFLHGEFKQAMALGGDKSTWTDESAGRDVTGRAAIPSWLTFLSRAFSGGGHQLVDVWSTGEFVVEEWSTSSGGPPLLTATHSADVILFESGKILEVRTYHNSPRSK